MSYETAPNYELLPETQLDQYDPYLYQERLIQRIEEPHTAAECLGGLALKLVVGGALMTGGGVMPGTEALTIGITSWNCRGGRYSSGRATSRLALACKSSLSVL